MKSKYKIVIDKVKLNRLNFVWTNVLFVTITIIVNTINFIKQ